MIAERSTRDAQGDSSPAAGTEAKQDPRTLQRQETIYVLRYDEEITFLLNEGVIRPGLLPSGFRES